MAKRSPFTQELKRTDTRLSFLQTSSRKTLGNTIVAGAIAVAIVVSYLGAFAAELYELIQDFTLLDLWSFLGSYLTAMLIPTIALLIIFAVGSYSEETIVFDKATNEVRLETQQKLYHLVQGSPVPLRVEPLSDISRVIVGIDTVRANTMGVSQTYRFDSVTLFVREDPQPFYSISLTKSFGRDPYKDLVSPTRLAGEIQDFLGLEKQEGN